MMLPSQEVNKGFYGYALLRIVIGLVRNYEEALTLCLHCSKVDMIQEVMVATQCSAQGSHTVLDMSDFCTRSPLNG
jgi:hypothetical protein